MGQAYWYVHGWVLGCLALILSCDPALGDIKCSGNWMWAAKLPHEGAAIYDACKAMKEIRIDLEIAIDGGKDSLRYLGLFWFARIC